VTKGVLGVILFSVTWSVDNGIGDARALCYWHAYCELHNNPAKVFDAFRNQNVP
jgi:hypothetical protein